MKLFRLTPLITFALTVVICWPQAVRAQAAQEDAPKPSLEERLALIQERFPQADKNKDGTLTREEAVEFMAKRRAQLEARDQAGQQLPPTHADVKYGDHDLQAFDLWLAKPRVEGQPTPLCIYIHGGGFSGGDKKVAGGIVQQFLDAGISFAAMNYRLTNEGEFPYPVAMEDAAYGLQFIRSKAEEWNLDPTKVACYGGSAGAGITLWLAFHDDLADPDSEDPVARQSTRVQAAATINGQSTYDMRVYREWFGLPDLVPHSAFEAFYKIQEGEDHNTPRVVALAEDASSINHLTKDDKVPVYMTYKSPNEKVTMESTQNFWVHHVLLGLKLQEAMQEFGLECTVTAPGMEDETYEDMFAFLIAKLSE